MPETLQIQEIMQKVNQVEEMVQDVQSEANKNKVFSDQQSQNDEAMDKVNKLIKVT